MGTLFLTSTGLSEPHIFSRFDTHVKENGYRSVAIVTTAAENKSNNKYSLLAKEQFYSLGLKPVFVDLEENPGFDFSAYDVLYVCGGDTDKLLHFSVKAGFDNSIKALLKRGGTYIGVSAGTIILCPTISTSEKASANITALNIIPFHVAVHFDKSKEERIRQIETQHTTRVERLSNAEALLVTEGNLIERI